MLFSKINRIVLLSLAILTSLFVEIPSHPLAVKSGIISYEIRGETILNKETNLSIRGKARLCFDNWGEEKIEEEIGVVLTRGAIKHKQEIRRFEQHTKEKIIVADFETEQLLERTKTLSPYRDERENLEKKGQEMLAGVLCDVWEGPGIKKCIYKGLVLRLESQVLDVHYSRVAYELQLGSASLENKCEVPDYPVHEFGLFKDKVKTKNISQSENLCKVLKDIAFDNSLKKTASKDFKVDDKKRQKFINFIGADIYKRQKKVLPELLTALKKTRECLQTGEDPFTANQCIENFSRMKAKLGTQEEDYIILWDEKRKNTLLDKIEDELMHLQSRMPCINRAKNINDLSSCLQ